MALNKLERPIDIPIYIDSIVNSFCNGKLKFTDADKEFFRITRKLTQDEKPSKPKSNK